MGDTDPGAPAVVPAPHPDDAPAVILYTSGTTSDPKGVVLTHANLLAEATAVFQVVDVDEHDAVLGVLPLFHALAQMANLLLPFYVGEHAVGWLRPSFANLLARWPHHFEVNAAFVALRATPDTPHGRTLALEEVTRALAADGVIRGWRDEHVSVSHSYAAPELLRIERSATRHFGMIAYAAHVTGFTRRDGEPCLWIARRAATKSVDPDKLGNLVGERIATGFTVQETVVKEAWEEAGTPAALVQGLACASVVRAEYSVPEGLHREILFTHDLWLPEDFRPQNQDGEVARLYCLSIPK